MIEVIMMKGKSFLVGFLIGGAVAGISTLLTVPSSGEKTRMNMKANTDVWIKHFSEVKDCIKELQKTLSSSSLEGKAELKNFISDIKTVVSDWKQEIHPHQQELQKELQEIEYSIQELESNIYKKSDKNTK
jgi:gas vesicle protein